MEKRIKLNRIFTWILLGISCVVQVYVWYEIIDSAGRGGYNGLGAFFLGLLAVPTALCIVASIIFLVLLGKKKNPRTGLWIVTMFTTFVPFILSFVVVCMMTEDTDNIIADLLCISFVALGAVYLIFSIRAINAAKNLKRQAKAQQQPVQLVQPVQQYQQPMQPVQPVQQYQQPIQPVQQYQQPQQPQQ